MRLLLTKYVVILFAALSLPSCSSAVSTKSESTSLHLGESDYVELVDFLYDFAGKHYLDVKWFGWLDGKDIWQYPSSDKTMDFKIKLTFEEEKFGYIFVSNNYKQGTATLSIDYGKQTSWMVGSAWQDRQPAWLKVVEEFKAAVTDKGWRIEVLHRYNFN